MKRLSVLLLTSTLLTTPAMAQIYFGFGDKHTAATWLMQRGVPIWQAAGYLGMSSEMIERTYGHHHPDYMRDAAKAITTKQPKNVSLVVSLVEPEDDRTKRQKT
jgi:hypothetical protein